MWQFILALWSRIEWHWPRLEATVYRTSSYYGLCLFRQYIRLGKREDDGSDERFESWGFSTGDGQIYLTWGADS